MSPQTDPLASILEVLEMYHAGILTADELAAVLGFVGAVPVLSHGEIHLRSGKSGV